MKKIRKVLVGIVAILVLCASSMTAFAKVADDPNEAVGYLRVYDKNGKAELDLDATCVIKGDDVVVFSIPNFTKEEVKDRSFTFRLVGQEKEYDLEYRTTVENVYSAFTVGGTTDNIPALGTEKWESAKTVAVLYYDQTESRRVKESVTVDGELENTEGIYILSNVPDAATPGATIIDMDTGNYIGMLLQDSDQGKGYGISVDYIAATVDLYADSGDESSEGQTGSETTGSSETGEGSDTGSSEEKEGKSHSVTFLSVLMGVVIVGLIVLILRAKAGNESGVPGADIMPTPDSDSAGRICIRGEGGLFNGRKFEIDGSVTIGRQSERCNICYPANAKGVSGLHCQLRRAAGGIELIDLGSSYGTFVNGTKITPNTPVYLRSGDRFYLANATNTFVVY